jgi:hypothetical protein
MLDALDTDGVRDHLDALMADCDCTIKNHAGLDTLNYLAHNIVVNAQSQEEAERGGTMHGAVEGDTSAHSHISRD